MPLVFTGCHDNLFLEKDGGVGDITFRVSTAQMKATAQSGVTSRATRTVAGHAVYLSKVSASDINLHRATDASLTTRGEMVTDDNFYGSFHVLGYAFATDDDTQPKLFLNDDYTKTVYDPCPVGYHVPRSFAFTGFTADGTKSSPSNLANIWSYDSHGVAFYSDRQTDSKGATIYFPVIDWLDNNEMPSRRALSIGRLI